MPTLHLKPYIYGIWRSFTRNYRFAHRKADSWAAVKELMLHIEGNGKIYYYPIKANRRVDEGFGDTPKPYFQRVA